MPTTQKTQRQERSHDLLDGPFKISRHPPKANKKNDEINATQTHPWAGAVRWYLFRLVRWTFSGSYAHFRTTFLFSFSGGPAHLGVVEWEASGSVWRPKTFHVYGYYYTTFFGSQTQQKHLLKGWLNLGAFSVRHYWLVWLFEAANEQHFVGGWAEGCLGISKWWKLPSEESFYRQAASSMNLQLDLTSAPT